MNKIEITDEQVQTVKNFQSKPVNEWSREEFVSVLQLAETVKMLKRFQINKEGSQADYRKWDGLI